MKFFVRDRKKNVLWEGADHIDARKAFERISLAFEGKAHDIVDETGRLFGTRDRKAAASNQVDARAWVKFSLPERLIKLIRDHAKKEGTSITVLVDEALAKRREPINPIADEKRIPFRVSVPVPLHAHLERVALESKSTMSEVGARAIYAWCEELEARRAA